MHEGHRERIKQKYLEDGFSNFAEHEVLEFLLFFALKRVNTNEIAHTLIDRFGSFAQVLEADLEDLQEVKGVGRDTAFFLKSIPDFSNYYLQNRWKTRPTLPNSTEAGRYAVDMIGEKLYEVFYIICMDVKRRVLKTIRLAEGSVDRVSINRTQTAMEVLKTHASNVILVHNHPSGSLHPSEEDCALTADLIKMFEGIGVSVIDHIIVSQRSFMSMSDRGLLN